MAVDVVARPRGSTFVDEADPVEYGSVADLDERPGLRLPLPVIDHINCIV